MSKIKAVLFDFDGVIADTMEDHFRAWSQALRRYDVNLAADDFYPFEGANLYVVARQYRDKFNITAPEEDIVKNKEDYYLNNHSLVIYPGVVDLIDRLKSTGIRVAMVTAGRKERLNKSVPSELLEKFDTIVSGDATKRGKPFPDPYLKAMENLQLKAHECIFIENAPMGIKSGKSAGMHGIAIASTLDKSHLTEADEIVESFGDLIKTATVKDLIEGYSL